MESLQISAETGIDTPCLAIEPCRSVTDLREDVLLGLLAPPRTLPPKYFYDERGAQLFDQICNTPEYYPTRVEENLLIQNAHDLIETTSPELITELGSGSSRKTRRLFDACENLEHRCSYAPFDVCEPMLSVAANELQSRYDWLGVTPMLGDYHAGLANLPTHSGTNLFVFLGGTIGNFTEDEAQEFISDLRSTMSPGDYFLLGADRVKDIDVLNEAYNDRQGLTAEFNLNVLRVLNREIGSNFDLNKFQHQAFFNTGLKQIEMYLVSLETQEISFESLDTSIVMEAEERILTEISRKFEWQDLEQLLLKNDFEVVRHYHPGDQYFSLVLSRAV